MCIRDRSWLAAGGNRRREALPHWCHSRGVQYADGLYLPTKSEPLADGISGATPRGSFDLKLSPEAGLDRFVVKVEVNHSTDFNETYPESAKEGEPGYSGGRHGSGQPAVVYAADVDLSSGLSLIHICLLRAGAVELVRHDAGHRAGCFHIRLHALLYFQYCQSPDVADGGGHRVEDQKSRRYCGASALIWNIRWIPDL